MSGAGAGGPSSFAWAGTLPAIVGTASRRAVSQPVNSETARPSRAWTGHPQAFSGTGRSCGLPLLYLDGELVVRHGDGSSPFTRIPGPLTSLSSVRCSTSWSRFRFLFCLWVLDGLANLGIGEALPDHGRAGRGQAPVGRARRQMRAGKIVVLMTGAAFFRRHAVTLRAAAHIHGMRMPVVALPGEVSLRNGSSCIADCAGQRTNAVKSVPSPFAAGAGALGLSAGGAAATG